MKRKNNLTKDHLEEVDKEPVEQKKWASRHSERKMANYKFHILDQKALMNSSKQEENFLAKKYEKYSWWAQDPECSSP